jgi:hypothetical protein
MANAKSKIVLSDCCAGFVGSVDQDFLAKKNEDETE